MRECYAFDVDGVLVNNDRRLRIAIELSSALGRDFHELLHDENLMNLDEPRLPGIELLKDRASKGCIVIITGRPVRLKDVTIKQILDFSGVMPDHILMRRNNDRRPSVTVKVELLDKVTGRGVEILEYHDDDADILRAVKERFPWIRLYLHEGSSYRVIF